MDCEGHEINYLHTLNQNVVLNSEGSGAHARVQVNFELAGTKWLVVAYANLELM